MTNGHQYDWPKVDEGNGHICRVVVIYPEVPFTLHGQGHSTMLR